jgi:RNA polymerase sigma-70 factor (ECF subfamily)
MQLAKEGDSEAFTCLYELYFSPVFRYIYLRTKDKDITEDLVQDVFLKIYKSISGFQEKGKDPVAYFFTIARNTVIDYWRKKKDLVMNASAEVIGKTESNANNPIVFVEKQEKAEVVRQAIGRLTNDQQEVIILKFIEGLSNQEVAKMLGKSEEAVRQSQCRALKNLRQYLRDSKIL